jgi:hypothetical protein
MLLAMLKHVDFASYIRCMKDFRSYMLQQSGTTFAADMWVIHSCWDCATCSAQAVVWVAIRVWRCFMHAHAMMAACTQCSAVEVIAAVQAVFLCPIRLAFYHIDQ